MDGETKRDKDFLIADNKRAIKNPKAKDALKKDPGLIDKDKIKSEKEIAIKLPMLESYFEELLPFVKDLRNKVDDISEETFVCAVYLLLGYACQNWNSFFILAKNGDYGSFSFIRIIKESLAQAELLTLDSRENKRRYLERWFSGGIIGHSACRIAHDNFMQEGGMIKGEMENKSKRMYHMESLSIHGSYIAALEGVSPFTEDFDYDGKTQCFRTSKGLDYAKGTMDAMNIGLKLIYKFLIKDEVKYRQLDKILVKYSSI